MIKLEKAKRIVLGLTKRITDYEEVPLTKSLGRVLAVDIVAKVFIPGGDKSAMDGLAVCSEDLKAADKIHPVELEVIEELTAAKVSRKIVSSGRSVRIMTGAPIPKGADAVLMQEFTKPKNDAKDTMLAFKKVSRGENVIRKGEDIKKGQIVLTKGTLLRPQEMGVLASLGITKIKVARKPRVYILATGDEVRNPQARLKDSNVRDVNSYTLYGLVNQSGADGIKLGIARDNPKSIIAKLRKAKNADIILISAGVSVGKYDFTKEAFLKLGIRPFFWKVAIKPGKPVWFGVWDKKLVFGLPGYPVSTMVSFLQFVRPCIYKMLAYRKDDYQIEAILESDINPDRERLSLIRVKLRSKNHSFYANPVSSQKSCVLTSMTEANGIINIPKGSYSVRKGEKVYVSLI